MPHAVQEQLFVNDGLLRPSEVARLKRSDPTLPTEELRRRYADDGYLFLKGLLPRRDVLQARDDYFQFLSPSGLLRDGTAPVAGIYDSAKDVALFPGIGVGRVDDAADSQNMTAEFVRRALDAHGQDWYSERLCSHPVLQDFMAHFTGWNANTRRLERTLLRNNIPGTKAIGVHYDQIFLRYGEPTSVTVWVPMGDIGITGGGLMYLENGLLPDVVATVSTPDPADFSKDIHSGRTLRINLRRKPKKMVFLMKRLSQPSIGTCWRAACSPKDLPSLDELIIGGG